MQDIKGQLGVQSYCFRGFKTNEEVIDCVKQSGLDKIELCAVHADFKDESTFDKVVGKYKSAGVEIVSIGVQGMFGDAATEEKYFKFCQLAGTKHMSVDFGIDSTPESYRVAEKLADKYDIRLCIHNHGGRHWLGSTAVLGKVFSETSERIGLCIDTAWALDSGEDPCAMIDKFADRIYGLHIKDFVFDSARKHKDVVVGTGNLDLPKVLKQVADNDKTGYVVLEYEGDVDNPVPAMKQCVEAVRKAV